MVCTINGSNRQRDVYFILGVVERAFDKWEAFIFITVANSIKTNMLSAEIYQKSLYITEYPVHPLIRLHRLEIHITLLIPKDVTSVCMYPPSLCCHFKPIISFGFELEIWTGCNAQVLVNQARNWTIWIILIFFAISQYFELIFKGLSIRQGDFYQGKARLLIQTFN